MIEPMSFKKRFFYFSVFAVLFVVFIPILILYSSGYRLGKDFQLVTTGGIYVYAGESGATIYLDGKLNTTTNAFQKGIFISNLAPSTYALSISKAGDFPWSKVVSVLPQQVSELYPFLVALKPSMATVTPMVVDDAGNQTANPEYASVLSLFQTQLASPTMPVSTSTVAATTSSSTQALLKSLTRRNVSLWKDANGIYAQWIGSLSDIPAYFCSQATSTCTTRITVYRNTHIGALDFYPGRNDIILFAASDGLYAAELDTRPAQNVDELIKAPKLDFRVQNGENVFVKKGANYYQIGL
jgi:hypothetical protein